MSTIEKALEKQRQLEREKSLQQDQQTAPLIGEEKVDLDGPVAEAPLKPKLKTHRSGPPPLQPMTAPEVPADLLSNNGSQEEQPNRQDAMEAPASRPDQLVEIDIERLESLGMVTPNETFTHIKEEYRYIKRPLLNNAFGAGSTTLTRPNLVLVTSSFSGEGKTYTTVNLAISMALEEDRKVLLVDADVIKPHICERLGIPDGQLGLMDYLTGNAEVEDIMFNTNIPNLKLITAGRRHHHSNEFIASEKMKRFMDELSDRYPDRIVIFDTSPLLGASETNVLAQMTGQAVVVVEEERTTHAQLQQALSLLDPNMAIGLVLNKSKSRRREYYGYYYASSS
ncbi:exopolysaccharide biosynthesis protein [Motiliproteus coralliicola]|uniref:non-specific protein-tyrosine kinase n=1 Tax=Motiliproteus coralliicola TaxID=2283196 RepID=A0A369WT15_9GAMM|nr:XrtA-associated tyrosine autokinase [Motiliproteus coralliicola]RDE24209.1 exopolysaccharide biosynthesis protein [Motiliproteus coralliicola]